MLGFLIGRAAPKRYSLNKVKHSYFKHEMKLVLVPFSRTKDFPIAIETPTLHPQTIIANGCIQLNTQSSGFGLMLFPLLLISASAQLAFG